MQAQGLLLELSKKKASNPKPILIAYFGQSNAGGRVPIANASASELLPQSNIKIWNEHNQDFELLDIPDNNQSGYNLFGSEVVFSAKASTKYPDQTIYLVKYHVGNTKISYWSDGGIGRDLFELAFIKPAINYLRGQGIEPRLTVFYHQGEDDNSATYGGATHLTALRSFIDSLRADWGEIPIVFGEIASGTYSINANFHTVAFEYPNIAVALMEGESLIDAVHFDNDAIRVLGNQQIDLMPMIYGGEIKLPLPAPYYYYVRNLQFSEIETNTYSLLIDFEYCNITEDSTSFYIDDVLQGKGLIQNYGDSVFTLSNLLADSLEHTLKIMSEYDGTFVEKVFTAPDSASDAVVSIDFSGYSVPTTDPTKFENWYGSHAIGTSPEGSKGLVLDSNVGGLYTNNGIRTCRLLNAPLTSMSFSLDLDLLRESTSTSLIQQHIMFRSTAPSGEVKGYRITIWNYRVYFYDDWGAGITAIGGYYNIPNATVNVWRKFKLEVNGYNYVLSYSDNDGTDYTQIFNITIADQLNFGTKDYSYYDVGSICIGSGGTSPELGWFKNINITF